MKNTKQNMIFLIAFTVFSFAFVRTAFAGVGYSNFREGDIPYIQPHLVCSPLGHVGINPSAKFLNLY